MTSHQLRAYERAVAHAGVLNILVSVLPPALFARDETPRGFVGALGLYLFALVLQAVRLRAEDRERDADRAARALSELP